MSDEKNPSTNPSIGSIDYVQGDAWIRRDTFGRERVIRRRVDGEWRDVEAAEPKSVAEEPK